jgi:hypothetical protein
MLQWTRDMQQPLQFRLKRECKTIVINKQAKRLWEAAIGRLSHSQPKRADRVSNNALR